MGIYSRYLFPRLLNWGMACETLTEQRRKVLSLAEGRVLEIGFGSGLNLGHYPEGVESLTGIDNNPGMIPLAESKPQRRFPLEILSGDGEQLPMEEASFETVVSTWTLCSVPGIEKALAEIRRVLKPGGKFLFIEHGLSDDPRIQRWQNRLNPLQKVIGVGCNINRDMEAFIRGAGLRIETLDRFYIEKALKPMGYTYRGYAVR